MADFIHPGWSVYIAVVTVVSIIACFLLAMLMSKRRQPGEKVDTTGHVWDGDLRELTKELNTALSGRGGGKPNFVQGSVNAEKSAIEAFFAAL